MDRQELLESAPSSFWTRLLNTAALSATLVGGGMAIPQAVLADEVQTVPVALTATPKAAPTEVMTQKEIDDAPFVFEGTPDEQAWLKSIYLFALQTDRGRRDINALKNQGSKIALKVGSGEGCFGCYTYEDNTIRIDKSKHDDTAEAVKTLTHEITHAVDTQLPSAQRKKESIGVRFYYEKMTELNARCQDALLDFRRQDWRLASARMLKDYVEQACQTLPDTPDQQKKAEQQGLTRFAQDLWNGGKNVSDEKLRTGIRKGWNKCYNAQAYGNASPDETNKYKPVSEADFTNTVCQIAKEMNLPIDGKYLLENGWFNMDTNKVVSVSANKIGWRQQDSGAFERHEVTARRGYTTTYRSADGLEQTTDRFGNRFVQNTTLPSGEKLSKLVKVKDAIYRGVEVDRYQDENNFRLSLYKDGLYQGSVSALSTEAGKKITIQVGGKKTVFINDETSIRERRENEKGESVERKELTQEGGQTLDEQWQDIRQNAMKEFVESGPQENVKTEQNGQSSIQNILKKHSTPVQLPAAQSSSVQVPCEVVEKVTHSR